MSYRRSVEVTSSGPLLLGIKITVEADCGGVHPYFFVFALTYDLLTGEQADWASFLTKVHAEKALFNPGGEMPTDIAGVSSSSLDEIYSAGWAGDDPQCELAGIIDASGTNPTRFVLFPTSQGRGLTLMPVDLANTSATCGLPMVLGKSAMESLGIPPNLIKSLLPQP